MRTSFQRFGKPGFISYVLVLSTCVFLSLMMIFAYRRAVTGRVSQTQVQLRLDYAEKEEAILRSIVAITPNRAMRAMQSGSSASTSVSDPLRWQNIFTEAITLANANNSIPSNLATSMNITNLRSGNIGDSALGSPERIFRAIGSESGFVSAGINRNLGTGYPVPLSVSDSTTAARDLLYPIISSRKIYGSLASGRVGLSVTDYPNYNVLTYPQINFGYITPGQSFVGKRNWWAFSLDVAAHDAAATRLALAPRNYVLSIYEIPSQLAISAASNMALGRYESGDAWQNVTISGGVFAGRATVEGSTAISSLSARRGLNLSSTASVGGRSFASNPFTPGVRETYQLTEGSFFPVSLASESGRAAFISINRGAEFFDRLALPAEANTVSSTTWNNYTVGAQQCAMRLDITQRVSLTNATPTAFRFSYMRGGVRVDMPISLTTGAEAGLPPGYIYCATENGTFNFGSNVVDVAYGKNSSFAFQSAVSGSVTFNNARFGDPLVGTVKFGYYRPSYPFELKLLPSGKICVAVYPKRFRAFLSLLGADSLAVNNSLVVNVDYTSATGSVLLTRPSIPCTELDYGVILQECDDMTSFTRGFSLVTNLRLFIGDDFNTVQYKDGSPSQSKPAGYPSADPYFPPCSLFTPEKRYGVEVDPYGVSLSGQIGSLASESSATPVRPLESKNSTGGTIGSSRITVNLRPITHPADLPPITMMNWLVLIEERRREFY